jgi:hypothetical protein
MSDDSSFYERYVRVLSKLDAERERIKSENGSSVKRKLGDEDYGKRQSACNKIQEFFLHYIRPSSDYRIDKMSGGGGIPVEIQHFLDENPVFKSIERGECPRRIHGEKGKELMKLIKEYMPQKIGVGGKTRKQKKTLRKQRRKQRKTRK